MTTHPLATCSNCQTPLDPSWKFCIKCGTPVPLVRPLPPQQEIPAAIRPEAPELPEQEPARKLDVALLVSVVLGAAGVALIVYLVVVVFGSHG